MLYGTAPLASDDALVFPSMLVLRLHVNPLRLSPLESDFGKDDDLFELRIFYVYTLKRFLLPFLTACLAIVEKHILQQSVLPIDSFQCRSDSWRAIQP